MIEFFLEKQVNGRHEGPSSFGGRKFENWMLLSSLLEEIWGNQLRRIAMVKDFVKYALSVDSDDNCIGFNGAYIEEKGGFFAISHEWEGEFEFLFPKEKFKQFIEVLEKTCKDVYSKSMYESPDRLKFIIDDDWNTRIEQVYLNADTSFFEKDGSGMPQFRFERVKGHQYRLVENDCSDDTTSKTLGMVVEDVWMDPKILDKSVDFKNDADNGTMHYGKTFLRKEGSDRFILGLGREGNPEHELVFSKKIIHRILVLNELFLNSVHRAPLHKLPGVIFFTFDEYWNLIPVPLFRPADKNFVDKE